MIIHKYPSFQNIDTCRIFYYNVANLVKKIIQQNKKSVGNPTKNRKCIFMKQKITKSKRAIIDTFYELRQKKELDKITVTELCQLANINKSTFYVYYHDIVDLAEQLETRLVQSILKEIPHPQDIFTDAEKFTIDLFHAYQQKEKEIHVLFADTRKTLLPDLFAQEIKNFLFNLYPQLELDPIMNIQLSFAIYGAFYGYINNAYDPSLLISTISSLVRQSIHKEKEEN